MRAPIAVVTVGPPGCGKSTFARSFITGKPSTSHISINEIRRELTTDQNQSPRNGAVREVFLQRIAEYLLAGINVVIDSNNGLLTERQQLISLCNQHGTSEIVAVHFEMDLALCLARNRCRQQKAPEHEVRRIYELLRKAPPTRADGFDSVITIPAQP
ncbi:MAG: AAA family ATPase [Candidatus Saccharibacteria bacterium]